MNKIKLTFINVGYGEAILIECPDDTREGGIVTALIDGGSAEQEEYADRSSGRITVSEYLASRKIRKIDYIISTHIHEDHLCGMAEAVREVEPGELWQAIPEDIFREFSPLNVNEAETASQNKCMHAVNDYISLCEMMKNKGKEIKTLHSGDVISLCDDIKIKVLAPGAKELSELVLMMRGLYEKVEREEFLRRLSVLDAKMNNYSLVLNLDCRGTRILLPGDTNRIGYGGISNEDLRADIFKIGHHGQADSIDENILKRVDPSVCVCCASSDRRYNSAHPDVINMIGEYGAETYFSDCPGLPGTEIPAHRALVFTIGKNGIENIVYE